MSFQLLPSTSTNSQLVSRLFHSILTCLFCFFHHCILPSQGCACLRRVLLYAQSTIIQKFPPCLTKLKTNILFRFLCPFLFTPFLKLLLSSSPKHCLFFSTRDSCGPQNLLCKSSTAFLLVHATPFASCWLGHSKPNISLELP